MNPMPRKCAGPRFRRAQSSRSLRPTRSSLRSRTSKSVDIAQGPPAGQTNSSCSAAPKVGLPRVTGEIGARANVGKAGTTLLTVDGCGERLGPTLRELVLAIRAESKARTSAIPAMVRLAKLTTNVLLS